MNFLGAFLIGGTICAIGQFLMDKFKLMPIYITCLFVVIGGFLDFFNIYDKLIEIGYHGATIPISSFGHSLTHAALVASREKGFIGLFSGIFSITSSGISCAIFSSFLVALIFKPRG